MEAQLGFGTLRLKRDSNNCIDEDICREMAGQFLASGGRYFEVAYAYSHTEEVLGKILQRFDRDSFVLTDKMPVCLNLIQKEEDYNRVFHKQLNRCGVSFFDCYLLHNLGYQTWQKSETLGAFDFLERVKKSGYAKRVGFSFHDSAEVLDKILDKHDELIDVVQLQINYLDWESPVIQSRACYEVARKHGKSIFVMEPIKGGRLACLPEDALEVIRKELPGETPASLALRFPASLDGVEYVLSGMTDVAMVRENLELFEKTTVLTSKEILALNRVAEILHNHKTIECTQCRYCEKVCPQHIPIPDLFHLYENDNKDKVGRMYVRITEDRNRGKASDCIRCGRCEKECSQHLPIRKLLTGVKKVYEPDTLATNKLKKKAKQVIGKENVKMIKTFFQR